MDNLKEYVVTAVNREILDELCLDIETDGGSLYIPNRVVTVANNRPMSRNTHYMLTDEEAETLRKDPRVAGVALAELERIAIRPLYTEIGDFDKSSNNNSSHVNWGLLRCVEGQPRTEWGSDQTPNQTASISLNVTGKNVDVIIIDGHIDPSHPEFSVNTDGSGGSRVTQYDWSLLNSVAADLDNDNANVLSSPYVYTPYTGSSSLTDDNNHGCHVAGTAAGNRQGWAKEANIYNISPYSTNPNNLDYLMLWDYIRAFHQTKSINQETGVKNPTICNCSYGSAIRWTGSYPYGKVTRAIYRGADSGVIAGGLSSSQLKEYGIYDSILESPLIPYYSVAIAADIADAIADGIIVTAAAGNEYFLTDVVSGVDYNNTFYAMYGGVNYSWYQHRGTTPSAVPGVISVGNVSQLTNESKRTSSNCGPRVNIFAPGSNIISSFNSNVNWGGVEDSRNTSYYIGKISGTSMASPQVCGVLACALEIYPNMTPQQALEYVTSYAKVDQITDTAGGTADLTSLQGAANRFLFFVKERADTGHLYPKKNYKARPTSGKLYPRPRIKR